MDERYWGIVAECLTEFHHIPRPDATFKVEAFRDSLQTARGRARIDMVFHENPFVIANDLAGGHLDYEDYRAQFEELMAWATRPKTARMKHA